MSQVDRDSPEFEPGRPRCRPFGQEQIAHLRAEPVRVPELHDAPTSPRPVAGRTRVAVDGDDAMPTPSQRHTAGEAGRSGPDDDHTHDFHPSLHS